ncbi:MAG: hypothetical protein ACLQVL_28145 [Terriglobia bacterium]
MAYEYCKLREAVRLALAQRPSVTLKGVAASLGVGTHTVARALGKAGVHFRYLRRLLIQERAAEIRRARAVSQKEVAYSLGYAQPNSLARYLRGPRPKVTGRTVGRNGSA